MGHLEQAQHGAYASDEERWAAVAGRDGLADGRFVYAVRTTGVYCRPSCPARRPRRENAVFFGSAEDAEAAGFRPCGRCRPRDGESRREELADRILAACRSLEEGGEKLTLANLAKAAGLSRYHFQRLFKATVGVTPKEYLRMCRAGRLRDSLGQGEDVSGALYGAGFGSPSRVYERSGELLGMSPARYRKGAPGERIRYGLAGTTLGRMLVAATERGVCAVEFGGSDEELVAHLRARFPAAEIVAADEEASGWISRVVEAVEAGSTLGNLPLDVRGTAFQAMVWKGLRQIPPGSTVSYTELAFRLGIPESVRAVAGACARNPAAVVVPCHRVVGKDGGLTGYRWGLERKRALLARERAAQLPEPEYYI